MWVWHWMPKNVSANTTTVKTATTKSHIPWIIIYTEQHPDWATARVREKYLKTAAGKKWLQKYFENNGASTGSLPA